MLYYTLYNQSANILICDFNPKYMNALDIIILLCFIPALIQGYRKGFISQAAAIVGLLAGVWMSFEFASKVSAWLSEWIKTSEQVLNVISFAVILLIVILVLNVLGNLLEKIIKVIMLGWLNRLLGIALSVIQCWLILGILIIMFNSLNETFEFVEEAKLAESVLYTPLKETVDTFFPYLKQFIK